MLLPRELLVSCFENKLNGRMARSKEHIFYNFELCGQVVASTHISPPNKYKSFDDDMVGKIARQLYTTKGRLDKSSRCDQTATSEIIEEWRSRLRRQS